MCGIAGIINHSNSSVVIQKMTDRLKHRGPDAEGFFINPNMALGHRRLSIIDLSDKGSQPMFSTDKRFVLVFNGEIYNYRDVKAQCVDYSFSSDSDSETLLAAYERWGQDCVNHLNGMYAFAIWDQKEKTLFFARDRLGVKPFYYYIGNSENGHFFLFSSEIRSLLSSGLVPKKIDSLGLRQLLLYQSSISPGTIVENINQLMPGYYGTWTDKGLQLRRYWQITDAKLMPYDHLSRSEVVSEIRSLLMESVELRMLADVPLGAFLSGGIDSSVIVAIMAQISTKKVRTCSVIFSEKNYDESQYAQMIAKKYNTEHIDILLSPDAFLEEIEPALLSMDSPSGDGLNTYIVSKHTRKAGLKVALSGLGGDELFAGYANFKHWFKLAKSAKLWWNLPLSLRQSIIRLTIDGSTRSNRKLAEMLLAPNPSIAVLYPHFRHLFFENEVAKICPIAANGSDEVHRLLLDDYKELSEMPLLSQFSVAELSGYTSNVLLRDTDQMSMAHGLEVREPFFDYRLVEYILGIPDIIKYPSTPKRLLVEALSPMLPKAIVNRRKMGFALPWDSWMKREMKSFCEKKITAISQRDGFDKKAINEFWQRFLKEDKSIIWSQVWTLVALETWLSNNID